MAEDWTALVTEPAKEYFAQIELQRFGLRPYLPQAKRRWMTPRSTAITLRCYPLFPGYILISLDDAEHPAIYEARGLRSYRPRLCHDDGVPWRAPAAVIEAVREAERRGEFDEHAPVRGDKVTMRHGVMAGIEAVVGKTQSAKALEILTPLLGGARATVAQSAVMRA
jgi:Transcription termination factor nusG